MEADAWPDRTGPAIGALHAWKRAVAQTDGRLVRLGCWFMALDMVTALSACFAPAIESILTIARLGAILILVPAALRTLAIQHAEREDADLVKAIAIAVGAAAVYLVLRTTVVVEVCAL